MRILIGLCLLCPLLHADGLRDNDPSSVRRIPAEGVSLSAEEQERFSGKLKTLDKLIAKIRREKSKDKLKYLPDVEIFHKALFYAMEYNEVHLQAKHQDC